MDKNKLKEGALLALQNFSNEVQIFYMTDVGSIIMISYPYEKYADEGGCVEFRVSPSNSKKRPSVFQTVEDALNYLFEIGEE